jgi:hypothetical protein
MDNDDLALIRPTAQGIVDCLRMLLEEAGALHLQRTRQALQAAMAICSAERMEREVEGDAAAPPPEPELRVFH